MNETCNNHCGLFDFMANQVGIKVLHPGGYKSTKELCSNCDINEDSHVLDLACGVGTTSFFIQDKYGCKITGIDIDENLINIAKEDQIAKNKEKSISFQVADGLKLPFADNTFDIIIAQAFFILIDNSEQALKEIFRVLKPGGSFGSLELSWFKSPSEESYTELKSKTCDSFIPRVKTFEEWESMVASANLTHIATSKKPMDSGMLKMLRSEGLANFMKIMLKMISKTHIRQRMMSVQKAFRKHNSYLGYGIYLYKK